MKIQSALYNEFAPFSDFFPEAEKEVVYPEDKLDPNGFLIIWGGGDIHPSLYGRPNVASQVGATPSARDFAEVALFKQAQLAGVPIVGVCRGAQLACALNGGILVQDIDGHFNTHPITTIEGEVVLASSLHHQMMGLWNTKHELFAWTSEPRSRDYIGITKEELKLIGDIEPEIVYFPESRCLAIQGHPEFVDPFHPFNKLTRKLLNRYGIISN